MSNAPRSVAPIKTESSMGSEERRAAVRSRLPWWSIVSLLVAAVLLTGAAAGPSVLPGDVAIARAIQDGNLPGAAAVAWLGNTAGELGTAVVLATMLAIALAFTRRWRETLLAVGMVLGRGLNPLLKAIADSPRPTPDLIDVTSRAHGLGFPSGHAMGATLLFGGIAALAHALVSHRRLRRLIQTIAGFMILATGFARVYVGAHWPSDVVGGYLWGTVLLLVILRGIRLSAIR
jgi:membrane-associated phospholipid phosphatase